MKQIILFLVLVSVACGSSKSAVEKPIVKEEITPVVVPKTSTLPALEITKNQETIRTNENVNVLISMSHFTPYCGGAAPSPEILANQNQPLRNQSFNLIDLSTNKKTRVTADSLGVLNLDLDTGKYAIQELFKDCSFSKFMEENQSNQGMYYQDMGDDCYKEWWQSYLGTFHVTSKESVLHLYMNTSTNCFTGNNPCLQYNGPYPP